MINVAVDIVKKHIEDYYSDEEFKLLTYGNKDYTFYNTGNWSTRIVLGLIDNEILFGISNRVRKKKILEGQLRLIGAIKYSEKWDCYGYDRNI